MDVKSATEAELNQVIIKSNLISPTENRVSNVLSSDSLYNTINQKLAIQYISNEYRSIDGKIKLLKLSQAFGGEKIDLFKIEGVISNRKIDINKICNDDNDDKVDLIKFTQNLKNDRVDMGILTDSSGDKLDVYRLCELLTYDGRMDLSKITDTSLNEMIDLKKTNFRCFTGNPEKITLNSFVDTLMGGKINICQLINVVSNNLIDINTICNTVDDDNVNLFKYTRNTNFNRIDLAMIMDSSSDKINVYRLDEVIDNNGRLDLSRIAHAGIYPKIDLDMLNFKCRSLLSNKICMDHFIYGDDSGRINLFEINNVLSAMKIDINRICNSMDDDNVNLLKYTKNFKDNKIDLSILTDSSGKKINVYRLNGLIDNNGKLDLSKITNLSINEAIEKNNIAFECRHPTSNKLYLDSFSDSDNSGKIDLFKLSYCINDKMIDINKICNSFDDDHVDLIKYTTNLFNGKIDLAILYHTEKSDIDVNKLSGLIDTDGRIDLAKITDSRFNGELILSITNFACGAPETNKVLLNKFTNSKNDGKIDLFEIFNCINNRKIDITKIANTVADNSIDILKYTIHQSNGKILIDSFRNGNEKYIYLSSFNGMETEDCFTQSDNVGKFTTEIVNGVNVIKYEYSY